MLKSPIILKKLIAEKTESEKPKETENPDDTKIRMDGRCGKGIGKCPKGQCCSRLGWYGATEVHCTACQPKYGKCDDPLEGATTTGKCGPEDGKCPRGQCCSKYGWCGQSDVYCGVGCQSQFGDCK